MGNMNKKEELEQRIQRVNYLVDRANDLVKKNPEQAEAYVQRVNWHKQKILALLGDKGGS